MTREWTIKSFKSGNSVALRLPKALGIAEGQEVTMVPHDDGSFSFWLQDKSANVLDSLYGAFSPGFMAHGRDDAEQDERDWGSAERHRAA